MQVANMNFDFNQLLYMIQQCDDIQKLAIVKALEKDTYKARFDKLIEELAINNLTIEDINKEVEKVRSKRYKSVN